MPALVCDCGRPPAYIFTVTTLDGEVVDCAGACRECAEQGWRPELGAETKKEDDRDARHA